MADSLRRVLGSIGGEVAALPEPYVAALAPYMVEAKRALERDVGRWLARQKPDDAFTMVAYRRALVSLNGALVTIRDGLPANVNAVVTAGGRSASAEAIRHTEILFQRYAGEARALPFAPAAVLAQGEHMLLRRYPVSLSTYGMEGVQGIQRGFVLGMLRGETMDQLTRRVMKRAPGARPDDFGKRAGAVTNGLWDASGSRWRAERIVRTEVMAAYNTTERLATQALNVEDPGWVMRWDAAYDYVCDICRSLDGQIIEVGQEFLDYVGDTYESPPAHPHCRCFAHAFRREWLRDLREAA